MQIISHCTKVIDDLLFVNAEIHVNYYRKPTYRCIHIPSLVTSTQLPGGSFSLMENEIDVLRPKCIMESHATLSKFPARTEIYSIPASPTTHPRYCLIIGRYFGHPHGMDWEVLEVEIDLSIPGPIKSFSRVSQQYTVQRPNHPLHDNDGDLLLHLSSGLGFKPNASASVRFLRVGKPGKVRMARLEGVHKMRWYGLSVDRDAGYVIIWAAENSPQLTHGDSFIWWLDERKPGNMAYSRAKELISSWSRGLLQRA